MSLKKFMRSKSLLFNSNGDTQLTESAKGISSSSSIQRGWKSEEINCSLNFVGDVMVPEMRRIKKTFSLGSGLCNEERVLCDNDIEQGELDRGFSGDSLEQIGLIGLKSCKEQRTSPTSQHQDAVQSDSAQASSDRVKSESIFSVEDPQISDKESPGKSNSPSYGEGGYESGSHTPTSPPRIAKSRSMPHMVPTSPSSDGCSDKYLALQAGSSDDLHGLASRWEEQGSQGNIDKETNNKNEFSLENGYDSYAQSKDWVIPATYEVNSRTEIVEESPLQPSMDFKSMRIQEWVNSIEHCSPLEENVKLSGTNDEEKRQLIALDSLTAEKVNNKVTPGMEAAKRYISSLNPSATAAQLSNHGLVVIPLLSAFVGLRVLNLSGNSIVRITAGALPRGLHVLNLSKNNIATIEGLRELTRLRVLDLSYNRILRIGHGLASCSSLRELYLAGNKISEVEGLHRLLKLTVLDLRFNKISTAKCLGQLAANHNSLQAISLEGNPAQKNVGDDQLKKSLQGLLPHLVYFNSQPIKARTLKDATDRSVRLGMGAHQIDRGLRSDKKAPRKASHSGASASTRASSSTHGRNKVQAQGTSIRHVRPPPMPTGTKAAANHQHDHFDFVSKLLSLKSGASMHRSRSEGTLGAI